MNQPPLTLMELLRESVIVQGVIAVLAILGTFVLLLMHQPIDDRVWMIDTAILGYFFGAKGVMAVRQSSETSVRLAAEIVAQNAAALAAIVNDRVKTNEPPTTPPPTFHA